jgi:hypothetical protein
LFAKQCVPSGKRCKSTAFRHSCALSSKRGVSTPAGNRGSDWLNSPTGCAHEDGATK